MYSLSPDPPPELALCGNFNVYAGGGSRHGDFQNILDISLFHSTIRRISVQYYLSKLSIQGWTHGYRQTDCLLPHASRSGDAAAGLRDLLCQPAAGGGGRGLLQRRALQCHQARRVWAGRVLRHSHYTQSSLARAREAVLHRGFPGTLPGDGCRPDGGRGVPQPAAHRSSQRHPEGRGGAALRPGAGGLRCAAPAGCAQGAGLATLHGGYPRHPRAAQRAFAAPLHPAGVRAEPLPD